MSKPSIHPAYILEALHNVVHFSIYAPTSSRAESVGSTLCRRNFFWTGKVVTIPVGGTTFMATRVAARPLTCIECITELARLDEAAFVFVRGGRA